MERIAANPECSTRKLLVEFKRINQGKSQARPDLAGAYGYASIEFQKALNVHISECALCLREEAEQERAA